MESRAYLTDDPRYRRLVWLVEFAQRDLRTLDPNSLAALRTEAMAFCAHPNAWPEGPSLPFPSTADQDTLATISEARMKRWQTELRAVLNDLLAEGFPLRTVQLPPVTYSAVVSRMDFRRGGSGDIQSTTHRVYRSATAGWWAGVAEVLGWGAARLRRCGISTCQRVFVARHPTAQGCGLTHALQLRNRRHYDRRKNKETVLTTRAAKTTKRPTRRN